MKKYIVLMAVTAVLLSACDEKKTNAVRQETASKERKVNGIARHVIDDALSRVQDAEAEGDDIPPLIDEPYSSDANDHWWISKGEDGSLEAMFTPEGKNAESKHYRLSPRGGSAYDVYPEGRAVTAGIVLRVKDNGEILEETRGSKVTVYKTTDRFIRDVKASGGDLDFAEEDIVR